MERFQLDEYASGVLEKIVKEGDFCPYTAWKNLNKVKKLQIIPGLNMVTIYQVAEYFEVPLHQIQNIYTQKIKESFSDYNYHMRSRFVGASEFKMFALSSKTVMFEGVKHREYQYRDFSIHIPGCGSICFYPYEVIWFVPYIKDSYICSKVTEAFIDGLRSDCNWSPHNIMKRILKEWRNEQKNAVVGSIRDIIDKSRGNCERGFDKLVNEVYDDFVDYNREIGCHV